MKKKFLTLFLAILCTFTSTNFIFAVVHHTSYQIQNNAWEQQPQRAPWCFDTCMKIVLKHYKQKHSAAFAEPLNPQQININTIINAHVPEEEIVHRVLLTNHAIGEIETINNAPQKHRQTFLGHITNFFDYYLGNKAVHGRIATIDNSRKINLLNGLLGVDLGDEMDDLCVGGGFRYKYKEDDCTRFSVSSTALYSTGYRDNRKHTQYNRSGTI